MDMMQDCRQTFCPALIAAACDSHAAAAVATDSGDEAAAAAAADVAGLALTVLGMLAEEEAVCEEWPRQTLTEGSLRDEMSQCAPLLAAAAALLVTPAQAARNGGRGTPLRALHAAAFFAGLGFNNDVAAARSNAFLAARPEAAPAVVGALRSPFAGPRSRCAAPASGPRLAPRMGA